MSNQLSGETGACITGSSRYFSQARFVALAPPSFPQLPFLNVERFSFSAFNPPRVPVTNESASHLHSPLRILVAETVKTLSKHWLAL